MQQSQVISTRSPISNKYYTYRTLQPGFVSKFIAWCNYQEKNRFFWLGISLLGGIGAVLPLTLISVVFWANNNFTLWVIACVFNVPILVVNLAGQPEKVTLPTLFFASLINLIIVAYSVTMFFVG